MTNRTNLRLAYEVAYRENSPSLMDDHLQTFEDCVWLYENSVKDFKGKAIRKAASKVDSWDEFKWLIKKIYQHLFIHENVERIKKTKNEIQDSFKNL